MRLTVLGRSPARPNPAEACAGYLVEGGGARVLIDIGPGIVAQLLTRHHPDELGAVIVSHMHADHMLDLVTLRWVYPWRRLRPEERIQVVLPPGTADQMLDLARGVGNQRHFEDAFRLVEHDGTAPLRFADLTLTPHQTQHYIPCWGFRAEADGRRLGYSADSAPCAALDELAADADLFLCEATLRSLDEDATPPEPRGHVLPSEAGAAAQKGRARRLILTHLPMDDGGGWARHTASDTYSGPLEIAEPLGDYEV
jgi:ribonuclease BN (tRNA processing enzyme)